MSSPDPRKGVPSASGMARLMNCPGSWLGEKSITDPEEPSEYAESGTRIAQMVEDSFKSSGYFNPVAGATESEKRQAERMIKDTKMAFDAAAEHFRSTIEPSSGISAHLAGNIAVSEHRMWSIGATNAYSGQADVMIANESEGFLMIVDHKSGWNEVAEPMDNWQLKTLAVLASQRIKSNGVYAVIAQPNHGKPKMAYFSNAQISTFKSEIHVGIRNAKTPGAEFKASADSCRYCKFRKKCDEAKSVFMSVATGKIPDNLQLALEMIDVADMVAEDIRSQARKALEADPNSVPGWRLRHGSNRLSIKSAPLAFSKVSDVITPQEFATCTSVKAGELTDMFATKVGLPKSKAREALVSRLGEYAEEIKTSPSLVRVKAVEE